jgi:DNA topoisomerase-3
VEKLLAQKKTDLLRAFISQRTRRKFSAYLVMGADGKTTFEFEPRAEGAKGKKPFPRKGAAEANGHGDVKSVLPKNVIKKGSRKKA